MNKETRPKFRVDAIIADMVQQKRKAVRYALRKRGIDHQVLYRIRNASIGDKYSPPADVLLTIATELEVPVEDLYNSVEHDTATP